MQSAVERENNGVPNFDNLTLLKKIVKNFASIYLLVQISVKVFFGAPIFLPAHVIYVKVPVPLSGTYIFF